MAFRTGSVSFSRFKVVGDSPTTVTDDLFFSLTENTIQTPSVGAAPEPSTGWVSGVHIFDEEFSRDKNSFGETILAAIRIDTNRVPTEVRKAYRAMAENEQASASSTGFISRREKAQAKEDAQRREHEDLASGRFRRSKMVPVLWNLEKNLLLAPVFSDTVFTPLSTLFKQSFDLTLQPLSSGALAWESLSEEGKGHNYDTVRPSQFTAPPAEASDGYGESRVPFVPWAHSGPEPKDFLGNEFLIWLWWMCDEGEGLLETKRGDIAIALDRSLDMACAWDATGKQSLRADGPTRLPEARAAAKSGKWPRKVGMIVNAVASGEQWELTLQADRFHLTGSKLPKPDEAQSPRAVIEHRLDSIQSLDKSLQALYESFLQQRMQQSWETTRRDISQWITGRSRHEKTNDRRELRLVEAS